jgi:MFS transporter, PAT family, beta-lactamase induction signal transducer AmpG
VMGACAACCIALIFAPPSHSLPKQATYAQTLWVVVKDCWQVCRSRIGWQTLLIFVLPLGSGGIAQLGTTIYREWGASQDLLATSVLIGAAATGVGALFGGYVCDRMDRKTAYAAFGVLGGVTAAFAALMPLTPMWFLVLSTSYAAALGMAYAAYSAATLEAIGGGAAATKYTLFASIANIPVLIMPSVDGWVDTHWHIRAMLWTELVVAVAGAAIFALVALATRPRRILAPI